MTKKEEPLWLQTLRWIGVLPIAIVASIRAYFVWRFIHVLTVSRYMDPESWTNTIFMQLVGGGIMGGIFVFTGVWVAPKNKKIVSYILCGLILIGTGMSLFATLLMREYLSLIGIVTTCLGAIGVTVSISKDDIECLREPDNEDTQPTHPQS